MGPYWDRQVAEGEQIQIERVKHLVLFWAECFLFKTSCKKKHTKMCILHGHLKTSMEKKDELEKSEAFRKVRSGVWLYSYTIDHRKCLVKLRRQWNC